MRAILAKSLVLLGVLLAAPGHADVTSTYYGDDDGFGVGITSGMLDPNTSHQGPGEASLTDLRLISTAFAGVCSFPEECGPFNPSGDFAAFSVSGPLVGATLTVRVASWDRDPPLDPPNRIVLDGMTVDPSFVASFSSSDTNDIETKSIALDPAFFPLLADGIVSLSGTHLSEAGGSGSFQVDFLRLDLITPPCGDGIVDPGQQCDDGNNADGDCCSSTCEHEADGDSCNGDGNACTIDACDGAGTCVHAEAPRDPMLCFAATGSKFQIRDSDAEGKDKLSWQWSKGEAFAQGDLGTPDIPMSTTYTLCVYDTTDAVPSLEASIDIAPSPTLWLSKAPKGFQYKDKAGTSEGVTKAQLKTGVLGKTKLKVSAGGAQLVLPAPAGSAYFNQDPTVVVQLISDAGRCWTSEFTPDDTKTNDAASFKAQTK